MRQHKPSAKPDAGTAMRALIAEARRVFPFGRDQATLCSGSCRGCALKLLDYLENELDAWEARLADGERPGFAELSHLLRTSRKIARSLQRSGLMAASGDPDF
jgi:hypothetical protein